MHAKSMRHANKTLQNSTSLQRAQKKEGNCGETGVFPILIHLPLNYISNKISNKTLNMDTLYFQMTNRLLMRVKILINKNMKKVYRKHARR